MSASNEAGDGIKQSARFLVDLIKDRRLDETPSFISWKHLAELLPFIFVTSDENIKVDIGLMNQFLNLAKTINRENIPVFNPNEIGQINFYQINDRDILEMCNLIYQAGKNEGLRQSEKG